ncbi:MAG: DUF58 domain-containing protein, partial [Halodesulfurarchaeum sp.]
LNVVVVPAVILVALSWVYVSRYERPEVTREAPHRGHRGDKRRLELRVSAPSPYPATVRDRLDEELGGETAHQIETDGQWLSQEIRLAERGRHTIGPTRITAHDPLRLWEREFTDGKTQTVVVYPAVRPLYEGEEQLLAEFVGLTDEREHFDAVREYRPGDPLRDINWKASAKRSGELFLTEYAGQGEVRRVTMAVEAVGSASDQVAEAAASVGSFLLDSGVAVGLVTSDGTLDPAHGDAHRRQLLELLAVLEEGPLGHSSRSEAAISVRSPQGSGVVEVVVDGDRVPFEQLAGTGTRSGSEDPSGTPAETRVGMDPQSGKRKGTGTQTGTGPRTGTRPRTGKETRTGTGTQTGTGTRTGSGSGTDTSGERAGGGTNG